MQLIDLTHTLEADTPVFPGDRPVELIHEHQFGSSGFNQYHFSGSMHIGTHLDGPMHMTPDARFVADLPLNQFIGKGVLIDVVGAETIRLSPSDRQRIEPGSIVLFHTGWDHHFGDGDYFFCFPDLEPESAQFLVDRQVKIAGFDTPSPDHAPYALHKLLLSNSVLILENLTGLEQLTGIEEFEVMAFPLKIKADGSLVRVVARI